MKRKIVLSMIGLFAGVSAAATAAGAQQPGAAPARTSDFVKLRPADPNEIVVSAPRDATSVQLERQARMVSRVDGSVLHEPLGRFRSRVCPGIIGMPRETAELMVSRIRYNAERIGATAARENDCRPNIIVAFVRDGKSELESLLRHQHWAFAQLTTAERNELFAETGPVRAWSNTVVRSRFGDEPRDESAPGYRNPSEPPQLFVANSQSHIYLTHRRDIDSAVVVVDLAAIDGMSINQVADYVTMRAFARTRPVGGDTPTNTILSLFDESAPAPGQLTPFDLAYLTSLYSSYDGTRATTTIAQVSRAFRRGTNAQAD